MTDLKIDLHGRGVHHNGTCVGRHGHLDSGRKVFVQFTDPLYDEMAFTCTKDILEQIDEDVDYIAFRDNSHDLTLFDADAFLRVLDGDTDDDHYTLAPGERNSEDATQVAVKMWENSGVFEGQGDEFELDDAKYDHLETPGAA